MSKTELATRMKTSRAALDRLLDAENPSLTLTTLEKVAQALGRRLQIEFVPA
jgi:antitoxin HicB